MSAQFDLRVIALGAGVQSSTLYLLAATGELPRPDLAIFADTQSEPPWVYGHLDWLEREFGSLIPIRRVTAGSLELDCLESRDGRSRWAAIPFFTSPTNRKDAHGRLRRQCTREYKIDPVRRAIREAVGPGRKRAEEWVGISLDEAHRAKPSRIPWITTRWPLLLDRPMRRGECMEWMRSQGFPIPRKSACVFCPFRDDRSWDEMKRQAPDQFERACEFDDSIRDGKLRGVRSEPFVHSSLLPLREVQFDVASTMRLDFGEECEGRCGL